METETGTVKAWKEERGMGFITPSKGGLDHFVHRSNLSDGQSLTVGAPVSFVPNWDADKDKPIATNVTGASPQPAPGAQAWSPAAPAGKGGWGGKGGSAMGTVKAWIDERGMGFIAPADGSGDLFVHRSMLADGQSLVVGTQVWYDPAWDAVKNKTIANNVCGASPVAGGHAGYGYGKGGPPAAPPAAQDNLYISGLPADATDESIKQIFGQYGSITSVKVLADNGSQERVAMVRMAAAEQAKWLLDNLNGNIPLGMQTVVAIKYAAAKAAPQQQAWAPWPPQQQAWAPSPAPSHAPPGPAAPCDNLYIKGFPTDVTNDTVKSLLGQYGTVLSVKVLDTGAHADSAAMVRMGSVSEAQWLVDNLNGNIPQGISQIITVKFATPKAPPPGAGGYGAAPAEKGGKGMSPYGGKGGPVHVPPPAQAASPNSLTISGLPGDSTGESVMAVLGQYGTITGVKMVAAGTALLYMGDADTATWLVNNLDGNIPQGYSTPISVKRSGGGPPAAPAPGPPAASNWSAPVPTSSDYMTGTVKHWVEERGMGFITPSDGSQDCFVHRSNLMDGLQLMTGHSVQFQQGWDNAKNKPIALNVSGAVGGDGVGKGVGKH
jgi:cold shock CspA family protein